MQHSLGGCNVAQKGSAKISIGGSVAPLVVIWLAVRQARALLFLVTPVYIQPE